VTRFNHQPRSGRTKAAKKRDRQPLGVRGLEALVAHRELEYLRHPTTERARKLKEIRRALERERKRGS
jgi:hypothetical protein